MSRKKTTAKRATGPRIGSRRKQLAFELIYVARRVFDATYGHGRDTAEMVAAQVGMTLEEGAAALFVENGEMALRKLLPDVLRDDIADCLRQWLEEVYCGPDRGRYEQEAAVKGVTLEQHLAGTMIPTLLAVFGAFGPDLVPPEPPDRSIVERRPV
jgi:hypothetical protein